ncbi:polysaccharide pyruvyl transferase family protein [Oceanicoccus sagamiensis]|uniref:Polysaccharide pyruvyl transferase domain-containing protein n=1 Tax=Oceanicoccus sagamiensis TaxID=716816 RepID=A0A1X9NAV4_9GAMM|nr:polysaccharide pyruvyl transferase family protein [Oceanicoccus sagamiensis]ARN73055.1 hypothetical protein BST96_02380 [Oceanicoccus sagamiensis]
MKTALILNFTGNTYHYGCYGTSNEMYHRLVEAGYLVNFISVRATHSLTVFPDNGEKFTSAQFANEFLKENAAIATAIDETDLVVVNGEGTLHRLSKGSMTLLYLIYLSKQFMKKRVLLINHSVFPNGGTERGDFDGIYKLALSALDDVVIREPLSAEFYSSAGIRFRQGFDSLPLYIGRYDLLGIRNEVLDQQKILLCGGIHYPEAVIKTLVEQLSAYKKDYSFEFVLGGKAHLAQEDAVICEQFQKAGLDIKLVTAGSFEHWCRVIASAAVLISGRFHYSIAGLALGVPCITFPSNTPKVQGVYQLLEEDGYLKWSDTDFENRFKQLLTDALNGELGLSEEKRIMMVEYAEKNYDLLGVY